jgi:CPA1 family monovalent cation:H+ antiporter
VRFASTALVFFLLGLLMGEIVASAPALSSVIPAAAAVSAVVIVLRLAWVFGTSRTLGVLGRGHRLSSGELGVLGWSGMRGVVSLALALALPALPARGAAADPRGTAIILTFAVIVATLVLQGLTLLPLITRLGAADPDREHRAERKVRVRAQHAGLAGLARAAGELRVTAETCGRLADWIQRGELGIASPEMPLPAPVARRLLEAALAAQRRVVLHARETCQAGDTLAERLSTEIDIDSTRLEGDTARFASAEHQ